MKTSNEYEYRMKMNYVRLGRENKMVACDRQYYKKVFYISGIKKEVRYIYKY